MFSKPNKAKDNGNKEISYNQYEISYNQYEISYNRYEISYNQYEISHNQYKQLRNHPTNMNNKINYYKSHSEVNKNKTSVTDMKNIRINNLFYDQQTWRKFVYHPITGFK